jgi:hypothetical protein
MGKGKRKKEMYSKRRGKDKRKRQLVYVLAHRLKELINYFNLIN